MSGIELRAWVYTPEQLEQALGCEDIAAVYVPMRLAGEPLDEYAERVILLPPEYLADCEEKTEQELADLRKAGFTRALAHTVGHIELLKRTGYEICGGNRLNCTNSVTARFLADCGVRDIILSPELTVRRINSIEKPVKTGFIAYGRLPLMLNRRCPIRDGKPCGKPNCGEAITDRKGNKLRVICSDNTVEILNSDVLMLNGRLNEFHTDFAVLRFTDETDILPIIELYAQDKPAEAENLTRGLYYRGVK